MNVKVSKMDLTTVRLTANDILLFMIRARDHHQVYKLGLGIHSLDPPTESQVYESQVYAVPEAGIMLIQEDFFKTIIEKVGKVMAAKLCLAGWEMLRWEISKSNEDVTLTITEIAVSVPSDTSAKWDDLAAAADEDATSSTVTDGSKRDFHRGVWLILQGESQLSTTVKQGPISKLVDEIVKLAKNKFVGSGEYRQIMLFAPSQGQDLTFPAIWYYPPPPPSSRDECEMLGV